MNMMIDGQITAAKAQFQQYQTLQNDAQQTSSDLTAVQKQLAVDPPARSISALISLYPQYQQFKNDTPVQTAKPISTADWQKATRLTTTVKQLQSDLATRRRKRLNSKATQVASDAQQFYGTSANH